MTTPGGKGTPRPNRKGSSPRVHVNVTGDVIEAAERRDSSHCMIADAIRVAVPNAKFISVDLATIRFTDLLAGKRYIYLTPRSAQLALVKFDQGEATEPFQFRIDRAHVLVTGNAMKARNPDLGPGRRRPARLEPMNWGENGVNPERRDGVSPPIGALAGGSPQRRVRVRSSAGAPGHTKLEKESARTGRVRQFGLRGLIR